MTAAKKSIPAAPPTEPAAPESLQELYDWLTHQRDVSVATRDALAQHVRRLFVRQERQWQQSKDEALQAMSAGFADRMRRMREELAARDTTVSSITRYFEALVADLTDRADRDPKTRLMNFQRFSERLEAFLALEQRSTWCAVGLVDIRSFKSYNDIHGHALGDRVIDRVARLLREHVRADDVLAHEPDAPNGRELHARFGGDEFCFLLPKIETHQQAWTVAERFRESVNQFDWSIEDERLGAREVQVDVGVVSLLLGPAEFRRDVGHILTRELLDQADRAMYVAKTQQLGHVHALCVRIVGERLEEIRPDDPVPS